jgi:hypothetical protein
MRFAKRRSRRPKTRERTARQTGTEGLVERVVGVIGRALQDVKNVRANKSWSYMAVAEREEGCITS